MKRLTTWGVLGSVLLVVGPLLPSAAPARPVTVLGSVTIVKVTVPGNPPTTVPLTVDSPELTGFAVIANPGLEKTITQQLPPYTIPVFIDGEGEDGRPSLRLLRRNLDTTLVLTNTTNETLRVQLTVRDATGAALGTPTVLEFDAHQTQAVSVSELLP